MFPCITPHSPGDGLGLRPTLRFLDISLTPERPSMTNMVSSPHSVASPNRVPFLSLLKEEQALRSLIHCVPSLFAIPLRIFEMSSRDIVLTMRALSFKESQEVGEGDTNCHSNLSSSLGESLRRCSSWMTRLGELCSVAIIRRLYPASSTVTKAEVFPVPPGPKRAVDGGLRRISSVMEGPSRGSWPAQALQVSKS